MFLYFGLLVYSFVSGNDHRNLAKYAIQGIRNYTGGGLGNF